jgi:membrane protein DedA with SNARE-associated domain
MEAITNWITQYGCVAIFCLLMLGIVGLPVPDEILLTLVGYLIFAEILHPVPAAVAAFLGSICGITLSYTLGRTCGAPLIEKYGRFVNLKIKHLDQVRRWFNRIGKWTLTGGYFFPGVRHFTGFVAGTSKLQLPVFAGYAYLGALFWAATFISLGYFLGAEWPVIAEKWLGISHQVHTWSAIFGLLVVLIGAGYLLLRQRLWAGR